MPSTTASLLATEQPASVSLPDKKHATDGGAAPVDKPESITLHGKSYRLPTRPTVVVCIDGFDPAYLTHGIQAGLLPTMAAWAKSGFHATARSAMPSLTNPNNVSIITGQPTAVHGIAGNYFLDRATGHEHMVVDDALLRGSTILAEVATRGHTRVAAVTAKDKLRRILDHGLGVSPPPHHPLAGPHICFSAETASDDVLAWLGRPQRPDPYSADLSLCVLDAGVKILAEARARLLYLTLSDYVQHKHAPGTPAANAFMAAVDARLARLAALGAVVAVTGDHGMSDKADAATGRPNVLFLQDALEDAFGAGCARVVCPITDPFVKHHGALGGFVRVHVTPAWAGHVAAMVAHCRALPAVEVALPREEAAAAFEMPVDREGDFVVVAKQDYVVGSKASEHDLAALDGHRLRSHGGVSEQPVPLLMSRPIVQDESTRTRDWRNFSIFDLVLNYGQE